MTTTTPRSISRASVPGRFGELVQTLPPRRIADEIGYENVIAFMDKLLARPKLTKGQQEFFETWAVLIDAYESENHAIDESGRSPIDVLKHLLEENDMSASDLGRLLGNRALGSKVLRGERQLSKAHIRTLCDRFNVRADLFL